MIYKKRMPESFHVSTTYCAADYFSILLHPQKIQLFTLYSKSKLWTTSQTRIRQKNCHNTLENHSIPRDSCFQGVLFQQHNGIAKVQPCEPIQRSLGAKPHLFCWDQLTPEALDQWDIWLLIFWIQLITKIKKSTLHTHWFALVSERAAWLVQMVRIHS